MVSKKNLMEIVKKLMAHVDKAEGTGYRDELLTKIIDICSQANYQHITNFEWYISILVELTRLEGTRHGHLIAAQMLDVAIRVKAIRRFAVSQMSALLDSAHLVASSTQRNGICEVLYAAAWICGEFSEHLQEPRHTLEAMLRPKVTTLPGHIQAVYVQNVLKLYACVLQQQERAGEPEAALELTQLLAERLPQFVQSADLEVQERASCILQLVKHVQKLQAKAVPVAEEVSALFAGELNPVAPKAQKKVPVPEGLDLDAWINEPPQTASPRTRGPRPCSTRRSRGRPGPGSPSWTRRSWPGGGRPGGRSRPATRSTSRAPRPPRSATRTPRAWSTSPWCRSTSRSRSKCQACPCRTST